MVLCCIPRLIVTYCYVILVLIGAMSGTQWGSWHPTNMTYGRWIWRCSKRTKCRGHQQAGKTTNTVSLRFAPRPRTESTWVFFHPIRSLQRRSGGASGRLPQRPKGGLWRTGWWGCGSQHGLIEDTWFGRKLWLDLHVHESMFVFKFQHGTLFYTGTHVPLPMNPRNVNYIYLVFLPQICQYIYDTLGETTKHIQTYTCIDYYRCVCMRVCLHACNVNGMQAYTELNMHSITYIQSRPNWCCIEGHAVEDPPHTATREQPAGAAALLPLKLVSWDRMDHDQRMTGWRRIQISLFFFQMEIGSKGCFLYFSFPPIQFPSIRSCSLLESSEINESSIAFSGLLADILIVVGCAIPIIW